MTQKNKLKTSRAGPASATRPFNRIDADHPTSGGSRIPRTGIGNLWVK